MVELLAHGADEGGGHAALHVAAQNVTARSSTRCSHKDEG